VVCSDPHFLLAVSSPCASSGTAAHLGSNLRVILSAGSVSRLIHKICSG
jgi:hypothetical protein